MKDVKEAVVREKAAAGGMQCVLMTLIKNITQHPLKEQVGEYISELEISPSDWNG